MSELVVSERARREPSPASHDAARILDRPEGESCAGEWFGAHELELVARFCIVALLCALASPVLASPVHEQNTEVDHILAAQQTRLRGLAEWRLASARVALIGEFYLLRRASHWATYLGSTTGAIGTGCIVASFMTLN